MDLENVRMALWHLRRAINRLERDPKEGGGWFSHKVATQLLSQYYKLEQFLFEEEGKGGCKNNIEK